MAFANTTHRAPALGLAGFAASVEMLIERIARYRLYRRTLAELGSASSRDLADLGLSQTNLRAAAYQAVYGATK
jgi:uncharacterized protein YjiS (DUF1127 family)